MLIRDVMPSFDLYQPTSIADAVDLANQHGADGWKLAGGNDSLSWFKDRVKKPAAVIDLSGIAEMKGISQTSDGGVQIGAMTTLADVAANSTIQNNYRVLADAAGKAGHPQIRNSGTIGGNISQDSRCHYYRGGLPCYRAGGNTCFADTPKGINREYALFQADRCFTVSPSDTAPAMVALDATMVIQNHTGSRTVKASDYFIGPSTDITRMTVLGPTDILTAIQLPATWAGSRFYFEKVSDRGVDFSLVNVASALQVGSDGTVSDCHIVVNSVACVPYRVPAAESTVKGQTITQDLATTAGQSSTRGAAPLKWNGFKIPLMQNLIMRAVRDAA